MKKLVFPLSALGLLNASQCAQAQTSSVTVYGVIDMSLVYTSKVGAGNNRRVSVDSGDAMA